jgi:hypothetical protein
MHQNLNGYLKSKEHIIKLLKPEAVHNQAYMHPYMPKKDLKSYVTVPLKRQRHDSKTGL